MTEYAWSIRRELWENRSVYLAPIIVAAVVTFSMLFTLGVLPFRLRGSSGLDPAQQHRMIAKPFAMAPAPIMLASFLVGLFYSLDALYGERRDRSILFWKSLPVSDAVTVLSKAAIPIVVLPAIALALSVLTFFSLLFSGSLIVATRGMNPLRLWTEVPFVQEPLTMAYGLAVHSLWFAPVYAFLLLVSAWARRTPVLLAVLPIFVIGVLERMFFDTGLVAALLRNRAMGAMALAFEWSPGGNFNEITRLTPVRFATSPGLWAGLIITALFLALAIRIRRYREPI